MAWLNLLTVFLLAVGKVFSVNYSVYNFNDNQYQCSKSQASQAQSATSNFNYIVCFWPNDFIGKHISINFLSISCGCEDTVREWDTIESKWALKLVCSNEVCVLFLTLLCYHITHRLFCCEKCFKSTCPRERLLSCMKVLTIIRSFGCRFL